MFDQPDLEHILRDLIKREPLVSLHGETEILGLTLAPPAPVCRRPSVVQDITTGAERTVVAAAVLGCDGATSPTRQAIGSRHLLLGRAAALVRRRRPLPRAPPCLGGCPPGLRPGPTRHLHARRRRPLPLGVSPQRAGRRTGDDRPLPPPAASVAMDGVDPRGTARGGPPRAVHLPRTSRRQLAAGPRLPPRRRSPPHPSLHRPGPRRRPARRPQPHLEAGTRPHRAEFRIPPRHLRERAPTPRDPSGANRRPCRPCDDQRASRGTGLTPGGTGRR